MLKNGKYFKFARMAFGWFFLLAAVFLCANLALAAAPDLGLDYPAGTGLSNAADIRVIIAGIIRVIIGFLGIMAVGIIIYAGWLWMTSEGNEEKIEQAKKLLINAVIGLAIILASFAIASFVLNSLLGAGGGEVNISGQQTGGGGGGVAALGSGIIGAHYPARNQKDVPRNTKIVVTFKEPMDPATLMAGGNINRDNVKIYKTSDGVTGAVTFDVAAAKTGDNKTFVFRPAQYLGSPTEKIWYSVALGKNIKKANGDGAFPGVVGAMAYDWMFAVGTFIDNTPPNIDSIVPAPAASEPRNVVVQINFSEAVDPVSASGSSNNFANIKVLDAAAASPVAGTFYISNQYKTVEFLTNAACGINSCGNTVYCLPGGKQIKTSISAATLAAAGSPEAVLPYNGVADMAGNSLDGNGDGAAQGPQAQSNLPPFNANNTTHAGEGDDYAWTFSTTNNIDSTPPQVNRVEPAVGAGGVDLSAALKATFSKLLLSSSLTADSVTLRSGSTAYNYWVGKTNDLSEKKTTVSVGHDQFNENANFSVQMNSGIKDIYQNCYTPCSGLGITGNPSCCNGAASNNNSCQ